MSCVTTDWLLDGLDGGVLGVLGGGVDATVGVGVVGAVGAAEVAGAGVLAAVVAPPEGPGTDEKSVSVDAHPVSSNPDNNIKGTEDFMSIS
jgi:hypothetical protein